MTAKERRDCSGLRRQIPAPSPLGRISCHPDVHQILPSGPSLACVVVPVSVTAMAPHHLRATGATLGATLKTTAAEALGRMPNVVDC